MESKLEGCEGVGRMGKKMEIYQLLQSNDNYKRSVGYFKQKILGDDIEITILVLRCIKNVLTYLNLFSFKAVCEIEQWSAANLPKQYSTLRLTEFSKMLALRFVREVYFEANYTFMLIANLQLSDILKKIVFFKGESLDQQRGRSLFKQGNSSIFSLLKRESTFSGTKEEELQLIGYSLHKFALQILQMNASIYKLLPFHEQYCRSNFEQLSPYFYSPFFKMYGLLLKNTVVLSSRFHYFTTKDRIKFIQIYSTIDGALSVKKTYFLLFTKLWSCGQGYCSQKVRNESFVMHLVQRKFQKDIQYLAELCQKIAGECNDRYFWGYLQMFLRDKLGPINSLLTEQIKISEVEFGYLIYFVNFLCFLLLRCCNPQTMQFFSGKYLLLVCNLYKKMLFAYCQKVTLEEEEVKRRKIDKIAVKEVENNNKIQSLLGGLINLFIALKEAAHAFEMQIGSKNYQFLRKYMSAILSCVPNGKIIDSLCDIQVVKKKIVQVSSSKKQFHLAKEKFVSVYLSPDVFKLTRIDLASLKCEMDEFHSRFQGIIFQNIYENEQLQDIVLQSESICENELQSIHSSCRMKLSTPSRYSTYKMNMSKDSRSSARSMLKELNDKDQRQKLQGSESSQASKCSFMSELKMYSTNPRPDKAIFSCLSKRKPKSVDRQRSSELLRIVQPLTSKKYLKNNVQSEMVTSEYELNNMDQICTPFKKSSLTFKQVLSSEGKISGRKNVELHLSSIKKRIEYKYPCSKAEPTKISESFGEFIQAIKSNEKASRLKRRRYPTLPDQQINQDEFKQEMLGSHPSMKKDNYLYLPETDNLEKISFCFVPRMKRELLKERVLLSKSRSIEIGLITHAERVQQATTVSIAVYVTNLESVQKMSVNIKCPSWLTCTQKSNCLIEKLETERQTVSKFMVELKRGKKQKFFKNYGDFPVLNMAYFIRGEKQTISESIPFLITKFCVEVESNQSDLCNFFANTLVSQSMSVHEKVLSSLKQLKSYYKYLKTTELSAERKQLLKLTNIRGEIRYVKLEYLPNRQSITMFFYEQIDEGGMEYNLKVKPTVMVCISANESADWEFEEWHILCTCFRSIFSR